MKYKHVTAYPEEVESFSILFEGGNFRAIRGTWERTLTLEIP
jgi:hypothetical protein